MKKFNGYISNSFLIEHNWRRFGLEAVEEMAWDRGLWDVAFRRWDGLFLTFELNLESSHDGVKRLIILPDFRRMIVTCDNDSLGASFTYKALNLNLEWVVIGPALKVMSQYCVLFPEVVKQYSILVLVSVPPLVTWLVE